MCDDRKQGYYENNSNKSKFAPDLHILSSQNWTPTSIKMSQKRSTISFEIKKEMIEMHLTVPKPTIMDIADKFKVSRSAVNF